MKKILALILGITVAIALPLTSSADYLTGRILYFTFDQNTISGTIMQDMSGNNNTGTLIAAPTLTNGKIGQGMKFNGTTQYVDVARTSGLSVYSTTSPYSVNFWEKSTSTPGLAAMSFYGESGSVAYFQINNLNAAPFKTIRVVVKNNNGTFPLAQSGNLVALDGKWHMVTWRDNKGTANLFVDGKKDSANFNYTPASTTITGFDPWVANGNIEFGGSMDEFSVYNRWLNDHDIQQLYLYGQYRNDDGF